MKNSIKKGYMKMNKIMEEVKAKLARCSTWNTGKQKAIIDRAYKENYKEISFYGISYNVFVSRCMRLF